jgi:asparagine N-glycosylation enzyme membrane subunit Stt3
VLPFFLWVRQSQGTGRALVATLILCVLPGHLATTVVGRPDNEMSEPLAAALLFWLYGLSCGPPPAGRLRRDAAPVLAGLAAFAAILLWRGAILWWAILAGHAALTMVSARDGDWRAPGRSGVAVFLSAAAAGTLYCLADPFGTRPGLSYNTVSWFHVAGALLAAAALSSTALVLHLRGKGRPLGAAVSYGAAALAACVAASWVVAPGLLAGALEGAGVVGGKNPWTRTIAQYRPLLTDGEGAFSLLAPLRESTGFLFLAPAVLLVLSIRRKGAGPAGSLFLISGWTLLALAVVNGRYENVFALTVAACGAVFLAELYGAVRRRVGDRRGVPAGAAAAVAATLLLLSPSRSLYRALPESQPLLVKGDLGETLRWMRSATPSPGEFLEPWKKPAYGVMARWELGAWIEYLARRPAVATVYGIETHGLEDSAALFLATEEREFLELLERNGARYVVLSKSIGALPTYAALLGRDPSGYLVTAPDGRGGVAWQTGPRFFSLVHTSLYVTDGQPAGPFRAVGGVRLVYESRSATDMMGLTGEIKQYKVFERVKGARLVGRARPGERVVLAGTIVTNQGRAFETVREGTADAAGSFALEAWYPTLGPGAAGTGVRGAYVLRVGNAERRVTVAEDDVVSGKVVALGG